MKKISLVILTVFIMTAVMACTKSTDSGNSQTPDKTSSSQANSAPEQGEEQAEADVTDDSAVTSDNDTTE
jgi:biopolymer transport protein ExbD